MKRFLISFFLVFICAGSLLAQSESRVHVQLTNGQFYRNVYLVSLEDDQIVINLSKPDEEEVLVRIGTEQVRSIKYIRHNKGDAEMVNLDEFEPGLYMILEMSGIVGKSNSNDDNTTNLGINGLVGYEPFTFFKAGLGLGLDNYDDFTTLPVFLDVRGSIIESKVTPFYFFQAGYSSAWMTREEQGDFVETEIEADWMFNPGFGIRFELGKADLFVSAGYKHQNVKITQEFEWGDTIVERRDLKRMTIGLGVIF